MNGIMFGNQNLIVNPTLPPETPPPKGPLDPFDVETEAFPLIP